MDSTVILALIGGILGGGTAVKLVIDWVGRIQLHKEVRKTKIEESEINRAVNFEQQIINTIFEKYVSQTDWITQLFSTKFEALLHQMTEQEKLTKDAYAQIEQLKKDIRHLTETNNVRLSKIEGHLFNEKDKPKTILNKPNDPNKLNQNWDNVER
jgi:hypothetical protein